MTTPLAAAALASPPAGGDLPRIGRIDDEISPTGWAARRADVRRFINWFGEFPVGTVSG